MKLTTQMVIRTIIPGLIIYILFNILLCSTWAEVELFIKQEINFSDGWSYIIILFSGILYHIIGMRNIIWKPIKQKLQDQVEEKLLSNIKNNLNESIINKIKHNRKIIYYVFYPLINGDESLKTQTLLIFFNGAIVTSLIDIITLLLPVSFYILAKCIIIGTHFYLNLVLIFSSVILTSILLLYISVKRHFRLSEGETDYIVKMKEVTLLNQIGLLIPKNNI